MPLHENMQPVVFKRQIVKSQTQQCMTCVCLRLNFKIWCQDNLTPFYRLSNSLCVSVRIDVTVMYNAKQSTLNGQNDP